MAYQHPRNPHSSRGAPFFTEDAAAAYKHFLPRVATIPAAHVEVCRAEPAIVRTNIRSSVDAILPYLPQIKEELPKLPLKDVLELPALALGLVFAAARVPRPTTPRETEARLARLKKLRSLMLDQLEIFAAMGLVSGEIVTAIRRGNTPLDMARDGVVIASLFQERAEVISGKHPFTIGHLSEITDHGRWLIRHLGRDEATRDSAAVIRDRFWTALIEGYPALRKVGIYLFGEDGVDARMPTLVARTAAKVAPLSSRAPASSRAPISGREPVSEPVSSVA